MSNVPRRYWVSEGIKNKPSYKQFIVCVSVISIAIAIFVFLYFAKSWTYLGYFEFKYYVNPKTGKEEGIITTILSYLLFYVIGLVAYAAFFLFQLLALTFIMGNRGTEFDDSLTTFSTVDKFIVLISSTLVMILDLFQIFKVV